MMTDTLIGLTLTWVGYLLITGTFVFSLIYIAVTHRKVKERESELNVPVNEPVPATKRTRVVFHPDHGWYVTGMTAGQNIMSPLRAATAACDKGCGTHPGYPVASQSCSCGFHALWVDEKNALLDARYGHPKGTSFVAEAMMYGNVSQFAAGMRAERQDIVSLHVDPCVKCGKKPTAITVREAGTNIPIAFASCGDCDVEKLPRPERLLGLSRLYNFGGASIIVDGLDRKVVKPSDFVGTFTLEQFAQEMSTYRIEVVVDGEVVEPDETYETYNRTYIEREKERLKKDDAARWLQEQKQYMFSPEKLLQMESRVRMAANVAGQNENAVWFDFVRRGNENLLTEQPEQARQLWESLSETFQRVVLADDDPTSPIWREALRTDLDDRQWSEYVETLTLVNGPDAEAVANWWYTLPRWYRAKLPLADLPDLSASALPDMLQQISDVMVREES